MAINYEEVRWDTTKYFNPSNMNHMDGGIKAACDKADANEAAISYVNSNLNNKLDKSGSDPLRVNRDTATLVESFNDAAIVITGNVPAIGFHNPNIEGATLYLQNGKLFLLFNNGDAYTLDMTYFGHTDV